MFLIRFREEIEGITVVMVGITEAIVAILLFGYKSVPKSVSFEFLIGNTMMS